MSKLLYGRFQDRINDLRMFYGYQSIDLIFYDPPYGVTGLQWDKPFNPIEEIELIDTMLSKNGTVAIFGNGLDFALKRDAEFIKYFNFCYKWYWIKSRKGSHLHSSVKPLSQVEEISIFKRKNSNFTFNSGVVTNILEYDSTKVLGKIHPCQKPIELCKRIIEIYTNVGDYVLDICSGSGSIPQAARLIGRNFIGIESDKVYFQDSEHRLRTKNE
jgi:DNA modification methylase